MLGFPVDITQRLTKAQENSLGPQVIWHLKLALIFWHARVFPNAGKDSPAVLQSVFYYTFTSVHQHFHFSCQDANLLKIFTILVTI